MGQIFHVVLNRSENIHLWKKKISHDQMCMVYPYTIVMICDIGTFIFFFSLNSVSIMTSPEEMQISSYAMKRCGGEHRSARNARHVLIIKHSHKIILSFFFFFIIFFRSVRSVPCMTQLTQFQSCYFPLVSWHLQINTCGSLWSPADLTYRLSMNEEQCVTRWSVFI